MKMVNLAGCSNIFAGYHLPLSTGEIVKQLREAVARCCIVTYPAGNAAMDKVIKDAGGFVIWNTVSAHNTGKGMNIYLIPGPEGITLYEGLSDEKTCQPEAGGGLTVEQKQRVENWKKSKPVRRINWKKRYQALIKKADRLPVVKKSKGKRGGKSCETSVRRSRSSRKSNPKRG